MHVNGGCHCGNIKFRAEIDPDRVRICHCTDCQKMSGTAFRVVVAVPEDKFFLLSGRPRVYVKISEAGNQREQAFCADCGTPIYATSVGSAPRKFGIRVGAIEGGHELVPKRQYWAGSAVGWLGDISSITSCERQ